MRLSIFIGDIADAPAEALCTSTNPRLSLVMGTGASVRGRGGFEISRACEAIVEAERQRSGKGVLAAGSAHVTSPGSLPAKAIIHCVASDYSHRSSAAIVRACVINALGCAEALDCHSVAMPVLASGHAGLKFADALATMCDAIRESCTSVKQIFVVVTDPSREEAVRRVLRQYFPAVAADTIRSTRAIDEPTSLWAAEES